MVEKMGEKVKNSFLILISLILLAGTMNVSALSFRPTYASTHNAPASGEEGDLIQRMDDVISSFNSTLFIMDNTIFTLCGVVLTDKEIEDLLSLQASDLIIQKSVRDKATNAVLNAVLSSGIKQKIAAFGDDEVSMVANSAINMVIVNLSLLDISKASAKISSDLRKDLKVASKISKEQKDNFTYAASKSGKMAVNATKISAGLIKLIASMRKVSVDNISATTKPYALPQEKNIFNNIMPKPAETADATGATDATSLPYTTETVNTDGQGNSFANTGINNRQTVAKKTKTGLSDTAFFADFVKTLGGIKKYEKTIPRIGLMSISERANEIIDVARLEADLLKLMQKNRNFRVFSNYYEITKGGVFIAGMDKSVTRVLRMFTYTDRNDNVMLSISLINKGSGHVEWYGESNINDYAIEE